MTPRPQDGVTRLKRARAFSHSRLMTSSSSEAQGAWAELVDQFLFGGAEPCEFGPRSLLRRRLPNGTGRQAFDAGVGASAGVHKLGEDEGAAGAAALKFRRRL